MKWHNLFHRSLSPLQGKMFFLFLGGGLAVLLLFPVFAAAGSKYKIETRYTSFIFNSREDMLRFNDEIDFGGGGLSSLFGSRSEDVVSEFTKKVDLLFEKAQAILDMRKKMRKVRVRVYSNTSELEEAYWKIFKGRCNVRGWYVYEFNTVFLNVKDVHEGMLAHELGHAIIDHYLAVRPPRATAEILAKYVDLHLHEEVKRYD